MRSTTTQGRHVMGETAAVVKAAYEAFGRGDIEAVLGMLDPAVEWSSPRTLPHGGQFSGTDGALAFFQGLGGAWDPLGLDVESVSDVGAGVVAGVVRASGSLRKGGAASYGAVHLFTIKGGKITKFREYVDVDDALSA
jgi:ketosteroid isomerase-like protein